MSKPKLKSGLESKVFEQLKTKKVEFAYEGIRIKYIKKPSTYTPDFPLSNGVIIETKGRFLSSDRTKHLLIKEQHPELDIRFVFSNSSAYLSKKSKTTYADWCTRYGFKYADKVVPEEWYSNVEINSIPG